MPKPFFQGVSNKVNGLAQEYARGVLKKVQGLEVGTEAVVNFTKDGKCTGYYVGGQNSMKVKPPKMQVPYYSLHNHPSNGILSPEDIQQLIKRPQMQGIGAVGNAGALFTCEKVFGYSQKNAEGWFKALKKKYPLYKGESGKIEDALAQRIAFAEELRRMVLSMARIFKITLRLQKKLQSGEQTLREAGLILRMILSRIFSTGHLTQTAAPLRIPSICLKQQATGRRKMSASP